MRINRKLSKDDIFEIADDITIFAKYLNILESDIIHCIETGTLMESPLRFDDNDASAGFKYNNKGKLKLRDFSGYFWGDCFDLVAFELGLNVNNKFHFIEVLKHIYNTITAKGSDKIHINSINRDILIKAKKAKRIIDINIREFNIHDLHYWNDFLYKEDNVHSYLTSNYSYPIEHYWIDIDSQPNPKYYYKGSNPAYAYWLGQDANAIDNYRIYFPYARKPFPKFITNNSSWQGLNNLPDNLDALLLTKSNKDRISSQSFTRFNKYKIGVLAPPSENHIVSKQEYDWLVSKVRGRFANNGKPAIMSLYDFDKTGLNGSGHLKRTFGVPRVMFTDGKYGTSNIGKKDFTDTIPMYGKVKFYDIVNNYIDKIKIV